MAAVDTIPKLISKDNQNDTFDLSSQIPPLTIRRSSSGFGTARTSPGPTPHATQFFKTTILPDGRAISSYHVAGIDGDDNRRGSITDHPHTPPTWGSTQRLDFTERLYIKSEDRPSTTRYGNAQEPWVTTKLRHRVVGIVPNGRAKVDHFHRDRTHHPRPATTPAALNVWNRSESVPLDPIDEPPSPPAISSKQPSPGSKTTTDVVPPVVVPPVVGKRLSDATDVDPDVKAILSATADVSGIVTTWMQQASLFEREIARRFLRDIANRATARSVRK